MDQINTIIVDGHEFEMPAEGVEALFEDLIQTAKIPHSIMARFCNDVIAGLAPAVQRDMLVDIAAGCSDDCRWEDTIDDESDVRVA